jgi:hypothetical protein
MIFLEKAKRSRKDRVRGMESRRDFFKKIMMAGICLAQDFTLPLPLGEHEGDKIIFHKLLDHYYIKNLDENHILLS